MKQEEIRSFLEKFSTGTYSEEEHERFIEWLKTAPISDIETIAEEYRIIAERKSLSSDSNPKLTEAIESALNQYDLGASESKHSPMRIFLLSNFRRIAAAAIIILILGAGTYFLFFNNKGEQKQIAKQQVNDLPAPNSTKAFITFANGSRMYLDSIQNGVVAKEGGMIISKKDDQVIYTSNEQLPITNSVSYNTLTVPKGSKPFRLLLADGSNVWLDAATTIIYPTAFVGKERKVELNTGQAYFEVASLPLTRSQGGGKMPFIVEKDNMQVQVLGTHFNVNAFDDESSMKVTLLEGSVKVNKGENSVVIKPGQQAQANLRQAQGGIKVVNADLEEVMAWKNGNFQFEGADINSVMKQLARWYDVDVEIKGNITEHFGGTISRDVNVSQVFHMLQLTGEVNYKIEGKKIIVTP